jgi:hypothetical protein
MQNSFNLLLDRDSFDEKLEREAKEKMCKDAISKAKKKERIAEFNEEKSRFVGS